MIRLNRLQIISLVSALAIATPVTTTFADANSELSQLEQSLLKESEALQDDFQNPTQSETAGESSSSIAKSFFKKAGRSKNIKKILHLADRYFDQRGDISSSLGSRFAKAIRENQNLSKSERRSLASKLKRLGRAHQLAFDNRSGPITPPTSNFQVM